MLRRRFGRGLLAATLLSTLLVPAIGSIASTQKKLSETRRELGEVREELQAGQAKAGNVREQIDALEKAIGRVQSVVNDLNEQVAIVTSEVRTVKAQIEKTQKQIDKVQNRAVEQAVAIYKQGSSDVLDALLGAESLAELDSRIEMFGVAAEENTGALVQYGRLKLEIQEQNKVLLAKRDELNSILDERTEALAELDSNKSVLDSRYAKLSTQIGKLKDREGNLAAAADRIKNEIIANQAQRSVDSLGKSAAGFIWPLNGAVTSPYGPRWGRMHTGIDIDGYTGQPIVASKGGTVIMASSYSGYGNTVIVDHGGGIATLYAHLSAFDVSNGQSVSQGTVVGKVGCTGSCTGDHLHFEVRVNGSPQNPMNYLP